MAGTVESLFLILNGRERESQDDLSWVSVDIVSKSLPPWGNEISLLRSLLCRFFFFFFREMLCLDCHAFSKRVLFKLFPQTIGLPWSPGN